MGFFRTVAKIGVGAVGGTIGAVAGGPVGALVGFVIGASVVPGASSTPRTVYDADEVRRRTMAGAASLRHRNETIAQNQRMQQQFQKHMHRPHR